MNNTETMVIALDNGFKIEIPKENWVEVLQPDGKYKMTINCPIQRTRVEEFLKLNCYDLMN